VPTVFENYVLNKQYEGKIIEFALWDTAGQEQVENENLSSLSQNQLADSFVWISI